MSNVKLAVIYYSTTGTNYQLAQWAAEAGKQAGAEVKILKVQELAPQAVIDGNPAWKAHVEDTKDIPVATPDDIVYIYVPLGRNRCCTGLHRPCSIRRRRKSIRNKCFS
jgi:multimeric flavodoxin WrbA